MQHVGVVHAVAAGQRGSDQRQYLVSVLARPGALPRSHVPVNEFRQGQTQGQGVRKEQPSIGHQAGVVEGNSDAVGVVA